MCNVYEISVGQSVVGEIPPRKREGGRGNNGGGPVLLALCVRGGWGMMGNRCGCGCGCGRGRGVFV